MSKQSFVKSGDTRTPVSNSRAEVERMLRRYGATGFQVAQDYANHRVVVTFIVPDSTVKGAPSVPVKLPVDIRRVYDALYGQPTKHNYATGKRVLDPSGYNAKRMEQAERVAWRHLVLWLDAALSAAVAGMQTITEAFFAHAVVGGGGERMIEVVEHAQAQLGVGVQRLLTAPSEEI